MRKRPGVQRTRPFLTPLAAHLKKERPAHVICRSIIPQHPKCPRVSWGGVTVARLTLVASKPKPNSNLGTSLAHRASATEGEAAIRLLQDQGYTLKKSTAGQYSGPCPFHEGFGFRDGKKSPTFYIDSKSSLFICHSASCGERGNLQSLERFFGIDPDEDVIAKFRSREDQLREFERNLTKELRKPFYDHGLNDTTIERFRLGFEPAHADPETGRTIPDRYIIPYLDGRRPEFFRYYQPYGEPKWKYTWEPGAQTKLFNAQDAMGDDKGRVYLCESEQKAMLLVQLGYAAVGVPGAGIWRDEFQAAFTHARQIIIVFDNDNPEFHIYDKPDEGRRCQKCAGKGLDRCLGHNPGQEAALARVEDLGWRAKNVVLPLPEGERKVDINEYFMRDGYSNADFAQLTTGKSATPYKVQSLSEIAASPPEEAVFLVDQGILPKGGRLLVAGKPKIGKAGRLSTPVLTPKGWTTMGAIRPGDEVIGSDGEPTKVLQIHPQGIMPIYRVTMSDGSSTECTSQHLWNIQTSNDRAYFKKYGRERWRTVETSEIAEIIARGKRRHTYIPMVEPVQYQADIMPMDPYALGLLLGDGSIVNTTPTFTKPEVELHDALAKAFPEHEIHVVDASRGTITIVDPTSSRSVANSVTDQLRSLGLWGHRSWEKFIPECYLRASVEDRLALLQGLLDTDGWVQHNTIGNTSAYFSTTSEALKDGVVELVESLGGQVRIQYKPAPKFQNDGVGRPAWSIRVRLPGQFEPFRLTRKLDEWRSGRTEKDTEPTRRIVSVEYVDDDEALCITVANPDGLYVTEHFIVTHNSIFVDNLALSLASGIPFLKSGSFDGFSVGDGTRGIRTLLLDRELSKWSLYKRMEDLMEHRKGYRAAMENLLIDHDHLIHLNQPNAYQTLEQLVEQNGAEVLIMDTAYKFLAGDVESSSALMKAFEVLDKLIHETGVSIVMTHHMRKSQTSSKKENTDIADPDSVAGSFLWTGWPNATILLNYLNRSVDDPFNATCTFSAFRDHATPDPLELYRGKDSIAYTAIQPHSPEEKTSGSSRPAPQKYTRPDTDGVENLLLEMSPVVEEDFLNVAASRYGVSVNSIRPYYLDAMGRGRFEKSDGRPPIIKFKYEPEQEESWEKEHGLAERRFEDVQDLPLFDAAFDAAMDV